MLHRLYFRFVFFIVWLFGQILSFLVKPVRF
jgi:hypothetical protein